MTSGTPSPVTAVANAVADVLRQAPAGLLSDFDGTLSEVAPTPDTAEAAPGASDVLAELTTHLALVGIVTGRGIADVAERMSVPGVAYVGNHGLEWRIGGEHHVHPAGLAAQAVLGEALRDVDQRLRAHVSLDGVIFEDKVYSGSVHYRLAPDPGAVSRALAPILDEVAAEYGFRVSDGKMVYELRPGADVNKGTATRQLLQDHGIRSAVFLGDDVTDADAFRVLQKLREEEGYATLTIGVLTLDTAQQVIDASDYLLDGVNDVVAMLLEVGHILRSDDSTQQGDVL